MVYFECQQCNETVKKPKLAKHLEMCGSHYVSCIDCNKVFDWQSWESHTSCVSEAQKYQGHLFQAKESTNKGQVKQDAWVDNVQKSIENPDMNVSPETKGLLVKLLSFTNIPRKQKPFGNFVKNSLKIWDERKINAMWDVIFKANAKPAKPAEKPAETPAEKPAEKPAAKEAESEDAKDDGKKWAGWKRALDEELESCGGELDWSKLRDALVAKYQASGKANGDSEEHLQVMALAEIPEAYLSQEDSLVRMPKAKKARA